MASRPSPSAPSVTSSGASGGSKPTAKSTADPVLRNALRYTISAREYALLHKYVLSRSRAVKRRVPSVDTVARIIDGPPQGTTARKGSQSGTASGDKGRGGEEGSAARDADVAAATMAKDFNARAIRHSLRVFVATGTLMKLWEMAAGRLMAKKKE